MDIALDKVCELILRAREIDMKDGLTDPDSGSNPIDDGSTDILTAADDAVEEEMRAFIEGLNEDERHDLIALVYVGRGDMEPEEWEDALALAAERREGGTADYLLAQPQAAEDIDEGIDLLLDGSNVVERGEF